MLTSYVSIVLFALIDSLYTLLNSRPTLKDFYLSYKSLTLFFYVNAHSKIDVNPISKQIVFNKLLHFKV